MINLFNGGEEARGSTTSGGTESIIISMLTYRKYATKERHIEHPEILTNVSIHPAFQKAAYYFGMKIKTLPIDPKTGLTSIKNYIKNINSNTAVIALTGVNYPHGTVD